MKHTPTPPADVLHVAVVGVGAMGQAHCRTIIEQVPEMRLVGVVDAHVETAREVGAKHGVAAFASVAELLAAGIADAALVVTPHPLHLPAVEALLQAGLQVLCEKPLAETVSAADRMLSCARAANRVLGVMLQRRFEPVFEAALRFVREGGLGELRRSHLVLPDFRTQRYYEANPWRATWAGEGGGVLVNQAPHLMDLFVLLGGMPVSVHGHTATCMHDIEVEDRADARLVYANGAVGHLYASTNEPGLHEQIELVATHGSLTYRRGQLECQRFEMDLRDLSATSKEVWANPALGDVTPTYETMPENRLQGLLMGNFARHILRGEPLCCDAETGKDSLELANAIMLSSHLDAPVMLPVPRADYDALLAQRRATSVPRKRVVSAARVTDPKLI
jgi:predicted dehydrogenase